MTGCGQATTAPRRYLRIWRGATDAPELAAGVAFDPDAERSPGYAVLTTADPALAVKYGLVEEADLWDRGPEEAAGPSDHVSRSLSMFRRTALALAVVLAAAGLSAAAGRLGKIELKDFTFKKGGDLAGFNEGDNKLFFYTFDTAEAKVSVPADDEYTITIEASCDAAQGENAKFTLKVGDVEVKKEFQLTTPDQKEYTFTAKLKKGDPKLSIEFTNDKFKEGEYDLNLYVHAVKVEKKK